MYRSRKKRALPGSQGQDLVLARKKVPATLADGVAGLGEIRCNAAALQSLGQDEACNAAAAM